MLAYIFVALGVACLILFLLSNKIGKYKQKVDDKKEQIIVQKKQLGQLQVFYASQTGTAAKMASTFANQASDHGFSGVVINLKELSHEQFKQNNISIFFMANTGEGEPPQNSINFMKILSGKIDLQGQTPKWENLNYAVFGLGDTQYQHFNKIGIETDRNLQKLGAKRLKQIGLGDANSSMQDDYMQWKTQIWPILVQFRQNNPYFHETNVRKVSTHIEQSSSQEYLSQTEPLFANYRFCIQKQYKPRQIIEDQLDFKTKASLKGKTSKIESIIQKRQNNEGGSSLQLQVHLQGHPFYETASNIALWPTNDPIIVDEVIEYFKFSSDTIIDVQVLDHNKITKFNFVFPITIRKLLEQYVDLQFRVTKAMLKKLSKFQSQNPTYFLQNSSPKTTQEFKKLSQNEFNYLLKLVKKYDVKLPFQDFVQLSDSLGPRLFTIASAWKAQKNVAVIASIVENGLISKHFNRNPKFMKAELRKSTFTSIDKWKKVIFVGAGTGFAPFRGYLQQKQLAIKENRPYPIITLYFGCRKSTSDFIYKQDILKWKKQGVINQLHTAFSRQKQNSKVYVQNLLSREQEELNQYINDPETAMLICGSLKMGKDVVDVLEKWMSQTMSNDQSKKQIQEWQKKGKLIKQLW